MSDIEPLLRDALATATQEAEVSLLDELHDDTDIFNAVDSFCIVDILLESETQLEGKIGRYVPLADETIFDAEKSPLKRWSDWVRYVETHIGN